MRAGVRFWGRASLLGALLCCPTTTALAADPRADAAIPEEKPRRALRKWYFHGGVLVPSFYTNGQVYINRQPLTGVSFDTQSYPTLGMELGYFLTENISVNATGGIPPVANLYGSGAGLNGQKIGKVLFAPAVLTANLHVTNISDYFHPYAGFGVNFTWIMQSWSSTAKGFIADSTFGYVVNGGIEFMPYEKVGFFFNYKKIFAATTINGWLMGQRLHAQVRLNPNILMGGITYRW